MKGIILAGGAGSRLYPLTLATSKQLLPVFDKPMIFYPLSVLLRAGIREILIISTPIDLPRFRDLLGDGSSFGVSFSYAEQDRPRGIAEALLIGRTFIRGQTVALILGDNIFYGSGLTKLCQSAAERPSGATIFVSEVENPARYGVVGFDRYGRASSLEEKPAHPASHWAVTGFYILDRDATGIAESLTPSNRGELEITDVSRHYLERGDLFVERLDPSFAWFDTGTITSLHEAAAFVRSLQNRHGRKIMCPEEIAFGRGYIGAKDLLARADRLSPSPYADYLRRCARGNWDG